MPPDLAPLVQNLGRPNVLVVGDYMLDRYLWGSVDRISPEAPIPVLKVDRCDERPGGAGSVVANLAALGARPVVAGIVGKDADGARLRELLKATGARIAGLKVDPSRPTTRKTRMVARSQQMLRVDEESDAEIGAAVAGRLAAFCNKAIDRADAVIVQDHAKGAVTRGLVSDVLRACKTRGVPVIVDPAAGDDYGKYAGATVLTPNRAEAHGATGIPVTNERTAAQAGRKLVRTLRLRAAVLTLDREGMAVIETRKKPLMVPGEAREVFDVTGAGDAVAAVIGACLADGLSVGDAARLANLAAGIEVGKIGVGTVSRREMLDRLGSGRGSHVKSRSDLRTLCSDLHSRGHTVVFTNGCFDLLHIGHVHLLSQAKKFGDALVVAINSDASVRRVKGPSRPVIPEDARAEMLGALECVDYVTIYDEDTPIPLLKQIRPDVIVKGREYGREGVVGGDLVESMGGRIELVDMVEGFSTSDVARRAGRSKGKRQGGRGYVRKET
jgi:D-beta-D-heptose 7-phosphate kinase/D-beta-D-heptose 1-phosphate adenosyltransferase